MAKTSLDRKESGASVPLCIALAALALSALVPSCDRSMPRELGKSGRVLLEPAGERSVDISTAPGVVRGDIRSFVMPDGRVLAAVDEDDQSLVIFDYLSGTLLHDIAVGDTVRRQLSIEDVFVNGFTIRSMDSIYALLNPQNIIIRFDTTGTILQRWQIPEERSNGSTYSLLSSLNQSPIVFADERLLISQQLSDVTFASDPVVRRRKFLSAPDVWIEVDGEDARLREVGIFPAVMTDTFYYDVIGARAVNDSGEIVYSYGVCDSIFVVTRNGNVKRIHAPSHNVTGQFSAFDTGRYRDATFIREYWATEPRYVNILWDPWRRVYYRIVAHRQELRPEADRVNLFSDKPWSVMILDRDFRPVGEQNFAPREYDFTNILVTEEGMLVESRGTNSTSTSSVIRYRVLRPTDPIAGAAK